MFRMPFIASAGARFAAFAVCISLIAAAFALTSSAQVVGTADLQVARQGHTATLLADGRVLIVGGEKKSTSGPVLVSEAEIFDPNSGTFSLVPASSIVPRVDHAATLLTD